MDMLSLLKNVIADRTNRQREALSIGAPYEDPWGASELTEKMNPATKLDDALGCFEAGSSEGPSVSTRHTAERPPWWSFTQCEAGLSFSDVPAPSLHGTMLLGDSTLLTGAVPPDASGTRVTSKISQKRTLYPRSNSTRPATISRPAIREAESYSLSETRPKRPASTSSTPSSSRTNLNSTTSSLSRSRRRSTRSSGADDRMHHITSCRQTTRPLSSGRCLRNLSRSSPRTTSLPN